ncbi:hypothetical protein HA050_12695 [Iodobacter sp. HSC-16F04]|uniref:Uncharacterized protein n=1 Tax=Iodobacter violaceini TaxID=3044271 RepID=A0ABX0L2Z6_9NEIS|nr:hypothetical protein [Iodobacter violacea]NHQ86973.1 hypothetical protein [Iodobacter violacea]
MNPLSLLNNRTIPNPYTSSAESSIARTQAIKPETTVQKSSDALASRAENLGKATTDLAQNLMQGFAQQLFGDAAKGMTFQFDQAELSSSSNFAAAAQQSAEGAAAGFRLEDASHFNGKGKLFTADGRQFDFEIDVRYQSIIEGASASSIQPAAETKPTNTPAGNLNTQFADTAENLLKRLSSKPERQPFQLLKQGEDGKSLLKLLGDMSLQLLNLPGGPRYLDLGQDAAKQGFQEQA